ncbi:hypothetical protein J4714_12060 [Staphylococcus epidermidis]|nr:hypothetical protein [Staphylococcus epidermidis]
MLIGLIYISYAIFVKTSPFVLNSIHWAYSVFLGLLLGETIQSTIITTQMTFSRSKQGWDESYLKQLTHIPQHL